MPDSKPTSDNLTEIHNDAREQFSRIESAMRSEREQNLQDRRFYSIAGAQWEGSLGEQFENKPKFEVNKIHLSVIRIINEYRNNRITVDFVPKDGSENDKLADAADGLYRADEQASTANEAYDNAFEESVGGGFGAWRLRAEYEDEYDEENDYQRINIEPIFDADSTVWFDLDAKRQDKADAKHCFVLSSMTTQSYIDEYEDDPASWPASVRQSEFDWYTPDLVYIAEYFKVEEVTETVRVFTGLEGEQVRHKAKEFEENERLEETLLATGFTETRVKKVKSRKVHKFIMSGNKILEDCGYIAGSWIPIVPVYGKRWFIDGIERTMGHVRLAKDPQRLKNMQLSKLGELSTLSATEKPILSPEQIATHELMWAEDNIKNNPYLLINPITDLQGNEVLAPPIAYTKLPNIPPAMAALLQLTEQDMQDILGNQQQGEEMQPNISGKAVELIQNRLDMQAFIYMSNMAKAIKRSGEIWLSMAKDLFVEEGRKMKAVSKQGEISTIELLKPGLDDRGQTIKENDFSRANFDIYADVGPSSSSKRSATVRALTGMMQITTDPETMQVLSAMTMMNMEGEGIGDVRSYFRKKLIRMGAVEPTEEEAKALLEELQNMPPDANAEFLAAAAREADANAIESNSVTVKNVAQAKKTDAETVKTRIETLETISDIDGKERQKAAEALIEYDYDPLTGGLTERAPQNA